MQDVLGNRPAYQQEEEEVKTADPPAINPAELNDVSAGEFRIEALRMKDAEQGVTLWESNQWDLNSNEEVKVEFPASMLQCAAIGREIVFFSQKIMQEFSIKQVMTMEGYGVIEEFSFDFGFVMPNTTNSWE